MNKVFLFVCAFCLSHLHSFSQTKDPSTFHYQTILRDLEGSVIANADLGIQVSILQTSPTTDTQYIEFFRTTSGFSGQVDLSIGTGDATKGSVSSIRWGSGTYSISVAIDLNGGKDYSIINTQPLFSVPYALHTNTAGGLVTTRAACRDLILNPAQGQMVFCSDCGSGETQVYNGTNWVTVTGDPTQPGSIVVQKLDLEIDYNFTVSEDAPENSVPLLARATPENAADQSVTWSTDDETVAIINQNGFLRHLGTGSVFVTATSNDCGGASASRKFTFIDEKPDTTTFSYITIFGDSNFFVNDAKQLYAALDSFLELDTMANWVSLDPTIATVSSKGMVTANAIGSARIKVTGSEYITLSDTFTITIRDIPEPFNYIFPTIVVDGYDGENEQIFIQRFDSTPFPGISVTDDIQDTISYRFVLQDVNGNPVAYDSNTMGSQILIITASDTFDNTTIDTLELVIGDSLAPIIDIAGGLTHGDTLNSNNAAGFSLPTATATDEDGTNASVTIDSGGYTSSGSGLFFVGYSATDANGNTALDTLVLFIADSLAPTLAFTGGISPGDTLVADQNVPFPLPVAIAIDNNGDTLTYEVLDGGLDVETLGCYTLTYGTQDTSGNADTAYLTVKVRDVSPPEILNKVALAQEVINALNSTPQLIAQVLATDNVGIASYSLTWLPINENFEGEIWIDNNGGIYATDSMSNAFEASFFYRIHVTDSSGLQDSTTMELIYTEGKLKDIRVKQYKEESWNVIGRAYNNPIPYSSTLKFEYGVGDTVMYFTAASNAFTTFDTLKFDAVAPGAGSGDFELENIGDNYVLKLKNAFDTATRKTYALKFTMVTRNTIDMSATVDIPIYVNFDIESIRESNPGFNDIIPASINASSVMIKDIVLPSSAASTLACPLTFANGIMGDLAHILDTSITAFPIIPANTARAKAKELIQKLPAYVWITKANSITRLNVKIPVKGKAVVIEYVTNDASGDCYWTALLDGLKPSAISSKLSALDGGTQAGIIVTTKTVTETDFECVKLPCLEVNSGAHVVIIGKPLANTASNGVGTAVLDPYVFGVVTPLAAGFSDPNLKVTLTMKAEFRTELNQQLVSRMTNSAAAAKATISLARKGVDAAQGQVNKALGALTGDRIQLARATRIVDIGTGYLNTAQQSASKAASALLGATAELTGILTKEEICTPNVCVLPDLRPGWCSGGWFGYPCIRYHGCLGEIKEVCIPNPVQAVLAETFGRETMLGVERAARNTLHVADILQKEVNERVNIQSIKQAAVDASTTAFNAANDAKNLAQDGLEAANINTGDLGKVANYLLDNTLGKTVSTSSITFETTLSSIENGSISGTLKFDASLVGLPKVAITFPTFSLTTNGVESAIDSLADYLISQIP